MANKRIDELAQEYGLSAKEKIIVEFFLNAEPSEREKIVDSVRLLAKIISAETLKAKAEILTCEVNEVVERELEDYEPLMRTKEEILAAEKEFDDKIWFGRSAKYVSSGRGKQRLVPKYAAGKEAFERILKKYGEKNLLPESDWEWGYWSGKLSALRWVLGDDWDNLDT